MSKTESQWNSDLDEIKNYLQPLITRMDADMSLLTDKYTLPNMKGDAKLDDTVSVTLPNLNIFISKAISILMSVERQVKVTSDTMTPTKTSKIEEFINDIRYESDVLLFQRGVRSRHDQACEFIVKRGVCAEQILLRPQKDDLTRLQTIVRPLDPRYMLWDINDDGLAWASVTTFRSKADIMKDYPEYTTPQLRNKVRDIWDEEENLIFINGTLVKRMPNIYGKAPFNIIFCPSGSNLWGTGEDVGENVQYLGESMFDTVRDIFPEMNRLASILTTMQYLLIRAPMQMPTSEGRNAEPPKKHPATAGAVTMIESSVNGHITPIPTPDIQNSTRVMLGSWDANFQRATFANTDYGSASQPMSAVAINALAAARESVLTPRKNALIALEEAGARMAIEQFETLGQSFTLGKAGHQHTYAVPDFKGEYQITVEFITHSAQDDAAAASIAAGLGGAVSDRYKREVILKLANPDEEVKRIDEENAAKLDPAIMLFRQMLHLINEANALGAPDGDSFDAEARIIKSRIINILKQRKLAETQPPMGSTVEQGVPKAEGMHVNTAMPTFQNRGSGSNGDTVNMGGA